MSQKSKWVYFTSFFPIHSVLQESKMVNGNVNEQTGIKSKTQLKALKSETRSLQHNAGRAGAHQCHLIYEYLTFHPASYIPTFRNRLKMPVKNYCK